MALLTSFIDLSFYYTLFCPFMQVLSIMTKRDKFCNPTPTLALHFVRDEMGAKVGVGTGPRVDIYLGKRN